jgi:hypothetical protein
MPIEPWTSGNRTLDFRDSRDCRDGDGDLSIFVDCPDVFGRIGLADSKRILVVSGLSAESTKHVSTGRH